MTEHVLTSFLPAPCVHAQITIKLENEYEDLTEKIKQVATDTKPRPTRFLTNNEDFGKKLHEMGHKRVCRF